MWTKYNCSTNPAYLTLASTLAVTLQNALNEHKVVSYVLFVFAADSKLLSNSCSEWKYSTKWTFSSKFSTCSALVRVNCFSVLLLVYLSFDDLFDLLLIYICNGSEEKSICRASQVALHAGILVVVMATVGQKRATVSHWCVRLTRSGPWDTLAVTCHIHQTEKKTNNK